MPKKTYIIAYVPVLHKGYLEFFNNHRHADGLFILNKDLLSSVDYLRKDLRAIDPKDQVEIIRSLRVFNSVQLLNKNNLRLLDIKDNILIFPDEDISREVSKLIKIARKKFYPVFLRWDRRNLDSAAVQNPKEKISNRKIDNQLIAEAYLESVKSSDIWRRVGAILIDSRGREVGRTANKAVSSDHSPWMEGDPRNIFRQGVKTELAVFMHAEAALVADAAKHGKRLSGASLYTTTFPCPWCAKIIVYSGISKLYYAEGYGSLDANRLFKDFAVKLFRVNYNPPVDLEHPAVWIDYKKT